MYSLEILDTAGTVCVSSYIVSSDVIRMLITCRSNSQPCATYICRTDTASF